MTNKELIKKLSEFPEDDEVDFMVFTTLCIRRCDIWDEDIMIARNNHQGRIGIMLNLNREYEKDMVESYERTKSNIRYANN